MKLLFTLFLLFHITVADIPEIRKLYPVAARSEVKAKTLSARLEAVSKESDKTLVAYKGASLTIVSRFAKKIPEKSKKFKEGAQLVEYAADAEPENIEIRLIRLSIQEDVPKIVNYKKDIAGDRQFILAHYKEQKGALKTYVANFIKQSKSFSAEEKQSIQ